MRNGLINYITFLLVFFLVCIISCTKEKVSVKIKGIVTNSATGLPLKNVAVWIVLNNYKDNETFSDSSVTNMNGEYSLDVTGKSIDDITMYVNKQGFIFFTFEPERNSNTIKNIILYPLDSYITFKIINKSNYNSSIYGSYWSSVYPHQFLSATHTYVPVPFGITYYETRRCPGDTYIYVTWDYFFYNSEVNFPNLDSIYVARGDTSIYTIQF